MSDQSPNVLKIQAEAALKRLEEARLHERCPKACKACSQKHRKCQFKTGQFPRCDLCAKNNRDCEIIPIPLAHARKSDDAGSADGSFASQSQQHAGSYAYSSSPTYDIRERSHRTSSYSSGSSNDSPVDNRSPGCHSSSSFAYQQSNAYQYSPTSPNTQHSPGVHGGGYPNSNSQQQQQQHQYGQYSPSLAHSHHQATSPSALVPAQGRDQNAYFVPPQTHVHSTSPSFVSSPAQWANTHAVQTQPAPPAIGQEYRHPGNTHPASPMRQASAPSVPHIYTGAESYVRTAQTYQTTSPASQGGSYAVASSAMYQMPPQNTSARYSGGSSGQGYNQSLNSAASGSANEGMYYQQSRMHHQ